MKIKWTISTAGVLLLILLFFVSCSRLTYDVQPDDTHTYYSIGIKVNVKYKNSGQKESFSMLLKYDDTRDKILFLSPLNQVFGLLIVEDENSILVNNKRKRYWQGEFSTLIHKIWGMEFQFNEFKRLIAEGLAREDVLKNRGIEVTILEKEEENPKQIRVETADVSVKIKINSRETGKGIINFTVNKKGMKEASIRELFE